MISGTWMPMGRRNGKVVLRWAYARVVYFSTPFSDSPGFFERRFKDAFEPVSFPLKDTHK